MNDTELRMMTADELRSAARELRRSSIPLKELIPLLQRAADLLSAEPGSTREKQSCYDVEASALSRARQVIEDVAAAKKEPPA